MGRFRIRETGAGPALGLRHNDIEFLKEREYS